MSTKEETFLRAAEKIVEMNNEEDICTGIYCSYCPASYSNSIDGQTCHETGRQNIKWFKDYITKHKGEQVKTDENGILIINPKQCKKMLTWANTEELAQERIVIGRLKGLFVCVSSGHIDRFVGGEHYDVATYRHAKPIPDAKEITIAEIEEKFGCKVKIVEKDGE